MTILLLIQQVAKLLPNGFKSSHWIYLTIVVVMCSVIIEQWESEFIISSQRIQLRMASITPYEISLLEDFCLYDNDIIKATLLNKKLICTSEVNTFFMSRINIPTRESKEGVKQ